MQRDLDAIALAPDDQPLLERLCLCVDALLAEAVAQHDGRHTGVPFEPAPPKLPGDPTAMLIHAVGDDAGFGWLAERFGLASTERALLALALAFEVEPAYGTVCGYLQDDARRDRPCIDWMLRLLCPERAPRLAELARIRSGPLLRMHLLERVDGSRLPWLARPLRIDEQVMRFLIGDSTLDERLADSCMLHAAIDAPAALDPTPATQLALAACRAREHAQPMRVHLREPAGGNGDVAGDLARHLAGEQGLVLVQADLSRLAQRAEDPVRAMAVLARECWFKGALLYATCLDDIPEADRTRALSGLLSALDDTPVHLLLASRCPWPESVRVAGGLFTLALAQGLSGQAAAVWQACARRRGWMLQAEHAALLAARFRFGPGQITQAIDDAGLRVRHDADQTSASASLPLAAVLAAARAASGHALERLARRIQPRAAWEDLVVPADVTLQLREIVQRIAARTQLMQTWGLGRRLTEERGVTALFFGPSGTGKTLAAEVLAAELGLDLFCIDLAGIVSKYIGETEKNLDRVFQAAESANAVLFFDEADALFGKRSEVKDAHDRYANLEVAYLLQKMEQFDGLAVLATNLRQNLDEAFTRRLSYVVNFPLPQEAQRIALWQALWPESLPRAEDVVLEGWARCVALAGGNVRNIVLAAASYAATEKRPVRNADLLRATRREYQKMGKSLSDAEVERLGIGSCA